MSEKNKDEKNGQASIASSLLPDIKKAGVLRKLKTMKKKYFVLRTESESGPARLEYYDNEKKYKAGVAPKRCITIKKCFNINRKVDAKQKLAIALYTKDDCFSVVTENEQSLDEWLKAMLELQLDTTSLNGNATLKPKFEHVWQVSVGDKSLACSRNMKGLYRLCLTNTSLTLVKMEQSDTPESLEFPLMSIRRCGHSNNYFFFELGRSSITGAGEFWLETEDVVIAQNMHEVTIHAMKTCREHEDMGPHRPRSSSNTETSRPIATRRPIAVVAAQPSAYPSIRNRCDSMPSRPRTISEGQEFGSRGYSNPPMDTLRSHLGYSHPISYSPPGMPNPLSPSCCSTDSAGSSLSIDDHDSIMPDFAYMRYSHSVPTDSVIPIEPPIKEEQFDYLSMNIDSSLGKSEYVHMGSSYSASHSASVPNDRGLYLNLNPMENQRSNTVTSQSSDYMDMASPASLPGDYIPMSPVGSEVAKASRETGMNLWSNNRTPDGYLYMAPALSSSVSKEGYLEMSPLSTSLPKPPSILTASLAIQHKDSNCSTSNTSIPSTPEVKPEIYHLDKVKSLLVQSDDTGDDYIRPVRAYSMGSRPQIKKTTHLSIQDEGSRIRAYSVGSQAASARHKVLNSIDRDLGSMRGINVKTGAKSSSAPLLHNRPPRLRPSGSRANMDEDLMEIDYTRTRSYGVSLNEKDFTIEPVGRSRSGSCSSSSAASSYSDKMERKNKMIYERDKPSFHSMEKNKNISTNESDYLPMSPSNVYGTKSNSRVSSTLVKSLDHIHPDGDYVSLDPSAKYSSINNGRYMSVAASQSDVVGGTSWKSNVHANNNINDPSAALRKDSNVSNTTGDTNSSTVVLPKVPGTQNSHTDSSEYMCMDFVKSTPKSEISVNLPVRKISFEKKSILQPMNNNILEVKKLEKIIVASASASDLNKGNTVPKTPPPSPRSGASDSISTMSSGENLLLTLKKHLAKVATNSAPNSRPCSTYDELCLNYASLDLTPPVNEDAISIVPIHWQKTPDMETKVAPLNYVHIEFSTANPNTEALNESASHL